MNNTLIGGWDHERNRPFTYYETIGGGSGARPTKPGASATHSHMTNTLNTPIEALEFSYPFQVLEYSIRPNTGGVGQFQGGDGIQRDILIQTPAQASLLTDRRITQPYGLNGGNPAQTGDNILIRDGKTQKLPSKGTFDLKPGDILSIRTPGGGGFGESELPSASCEVLARFSNKKDPQKKIL
jgi:N-methylhydantoinase B